MNEVTISQKDLLEISHCSDQGELELWLKDRNIPYLYTAARSVWTTHKAFNEARPIFEDPETEDPDLFECVYIKPSRGKTTGWIYIVRMNDAGPVKIGYSGDKGNARSRVDKLQTGNPYPLKTIWIGNGNFGIESRIHKLLARYRMKGEWFEPTEEVIEFIEKAKVIGFFDAVKECS